MRNANIFSATSIPKKFPKFEKCNCVILQNFRVIINIRIASVSSLKLTFASFTLQLADVIHTHCNTRKLNHMNCCVYVISIHTYMHSFENVAIYSKNIYIHIRSFTTIVLLHYTRTYTTTNLLLRYQMLS